MTLLSLALAAALGTTPEPAKAPDCRYDRAALLALEPGLFDQDMEGGWRPLADRGCKAEAAELLAAYAALPRAAGNTLIVWHEGQLRAELGQTAQAIALMQRTYKSKDTDPGYWNAYVDGTLAFLRQDRHGLEQARAALVAIPTPDGLAANIHNGRYRFTTEGGQQADMPWPPNLEMLDGFLRCFDRNYQTAYTLPACRNPQGD
ncbi:MAG: hypothetical protein GAK31_03951 [Stenotrophomonas maltophilia]|uniref:Tetratricopeptide repeat protein n=1 Tax=Stenotrophomonas maltophilia TaxID=40324 RepID=A0A7V8JK14_STEMA|nr:MAG: hypothetical protein GAK31_03951 [Stenotrophomonas maltophilia]